MRRFLTHQTKEKQMSTVAYSVQGMSCGGCAKKVRKALETDVPGLSDIEIDPKGGVLRFSSAEPVSDEAIQAVIERSGYKFAGQLS
jgi:copper chaperone CopZ